MSWKTELRGDTLIVEDCGAYLVLSPFTGQIARLCNAPEVGSSLEKELRSRGFFSALPTSTMRESEKTWKGFSSLTLFLTRQCNLRCVYCYGCPGIPQPQSPPMSEQLALEAADWFVRQLRGEKIRIGFHGGGEPTLEQEIIRKVVSRIEEIRNGRRRSYLITTNGTCDAEFLEYMMDHQFGISVSCDGPPEVQDRNRPMADGSKSSPFVEKTIRALVSKGFPFTVRVTYTSGGDVQRMFRYFASLGVRSLHLEPLFPYGREFGCSASVRSRGQYSGDPPSPQEFVEVFLEAMDLGKDLGIRIHNSHLGQFRCGTGYFCGAACGKSMMVTHDGLLVACLEVVDKNDRESQLFSIGRWVPETHDFYVDRAKLSIFWGRHADTLKNCQGCFARYHCAGGCAVKAVRFTGDLMERDRSYCTFTRMLVPEVVKRIAAASGI